MATRKKLGRPAQYAKPFRRTFMLSRQALTAIARLSTVKPHRSMSDVVEAAVRCYVRQQRALGRENTGKP